MTFGAIPKPAFLGWQWHDTATIYTPDVTRDAQGFPKRADTMVEQLVPCRLDPASSDEQLVHGHNESFVVYRLFLPIFQADGGGELDVPASAHVTVAGAKYECRSTPERYPREGYQVVVVRKERV